MNTNNEFITIKFADLDIIAHKKTGLINYTKLCKDLKCSNNNNHFKSMVTSNSKIWDIIILYEHNEDLINYPRNVKTLVDLNIFKMFLHGVSPKYFGTYGPQYLFTFVVMNSNINYYKYVNRIKFNITDCSKITDTGIEYGYEF